MIRLTSPLTFAIPLILLGGCAHFQSDPEPPPQPCAPQPKPVSELENLLTFAFDMANMSETARSEACSALLKRQQIAETTTNLLQLAVGRQLSGACGDIEQILSKLNEIPPEQLGDEPLRLFVGFQKATLTSKGQLSKKIGKLERKQKKYQSALESKDANATKANEARLLREKLEAIRSMEKQLDESGGDK
ncbi:MULTISPECIES: hypothetical protein [Methylomonas]|uniref:hypothetical protein n=1 Tax=Methylomonas TaxID=416 RepID=UPI001231D0D0|nr:hypothetical protein [Methylomonas rhizoryzae]